MRPDRYPFKICRNNIGHEIGDGRFGSRPRTHQTVNIGLDELIKSPAPGLEMPYELVIHPHKNRICVHGKDNFDLPLVSQASARAWRRGSRGGRSAARRPRLAALATAPPENASWRRAAPPVSGDNRTRAKASLEKDHELARGRPSWSRQSTDVNAHLPGDRFRGAIERCDGIGKARAVHVEKYVVGSASAPMASISPRVNLPNSVVCVRLTAQVCASAGRAYARPWLPPVRVDFPVRQRQQLGATGKKFRRATFVGLNMGRLMTDDAVERSANWASAREFAACR